MCVPILAPSTIRQLSVPSAFIRMPRGGEHHLWVPLLCCKSGFCHASCKRLWEDSQTQEQPEDEWGFTPAPRINPRCYLCREDYPKEMERQLFDVIYDHFETIRALEDARDRGFIPFAEQGVSKPRLEVLFADHSGTTGCATSAATYRTTVSPWTYRRSIRIGDGKN